MSSHLRVLVRLAQLATAAAQLQLLPLLRIPHASLTPRFGQALSNDIPLKSIQDYVYVLQVNIGDQPFDFLFDTGSSDTWVVTNRCQGDCQAVPQYSPEASNTLTSTVLPFRLDYLTGSAEGQISYDEVALGPYKVEHQAFGAVDRTADLDLASTATSGILGFCFPDVAAIPRTAGQTLLENVMSALGDEDQYYAFHLSRDYNSTNPGSLTLGTVDPAFVDDPTLINHSPVLRTGPEYDYWKLPILGLIVDGEDFAISSSRVPGAPSPICVLDTGTTLFLGPSDDVRAFYALLGTAARYDSAYGYQILCTLAVLVWIVLGNPPQAYPLHPADITWAEGAQGEWCTGGIQANDNVVSGDWLCGDVCLRNFYTVHYFSMPQPSIGLLSVTNMSSAMDEFRKERKLGEDDADDSDVTSDGTAGWDTAVGFVKRWEHDPSGAAARMMGGVAGGIGVVVGGTGVAGWRFWRGV
ncbi:aspartic peptidase domain-containing protein [Mycena galopus ATCC 62051]|nr:aspartic peptidase domain-containing protein [Mycena galopus ATCC 62051]